MGLVRSIGRWSLTALVINCIIGSGIFGVPGELIGAVGRASPIAMIIAGLGMGVILLCFAEVGSQFSEPGGVYLYARASFGRLVGLQVGWFWFLSIMASAAANANLFSLYLAGFAPWTAHGWQRVLVLAGVVSIPAAANYVGVRRGAALSDFFTVAKLLPLTALVLLGLLQFSRHAEIMRASEIAAPGWAAWANALLLLAFAYGGFEDAMMPAGEFKDPRRAIPFSLVAGLTVCIVLYTLLQFVIVATIGTAQTDRALATTAARLMGRLGAAFVGIAAMLSTYGCISATMLNAPRFLYSLAERGEFPRMFSRLHRRFNTPHWSVVLFAALAWLLAVTGTFRWTVMLSAGATIVFDGAICAALVRLRHDQPSRVAFRLPFGSAFSALGITFCVVLLTQLRLREVLFMGITCMIAAGIWWCTRRRTLSTASSQSGSSLDGIAPVP
jgi:amino acid transporter